MKKIVKLTENDLHAVVKNSVKRILNEMDWRTSDAAMQKSDFLVGDYFDRGSTSEVMSAINTIEEFLTSFMYGGNKDYVGYNRSVKNYNKSFHNSQASKLLTQLYNIKDFVQRKEKQNDNLHDLNDANFEKQHGGLDKSDFRDNMPDNEAHFNDKQKEFADWDY